MNTTRGDDLPRLSDDELIQLIRSGSEDAFRVVCQRHGASLEERVRRQLPVSLQRKVSIGDVLQDAWLVAWRRIAELEPRGAGSLRTWLNAVVDLKVREMTRHYVDTSKREVRRELVPDGSGTGLTGVGGGPTPSQIAVAEELRAAAARAFAELPESYREVIVLIREEGLTMAAAAERLGSNREVIKKRYGRAVARFAKLLARYRGGER